MGRTLASFLFLASLAAAILAGRGLLDRLNGDHVPDVTQSGSDDAPDRTSASVDAALQDSVEWQPIFGTAEEPEQVIRATPAPPSPSFDYALKGVIVSGDIKWAILSDTSSDFLVQEGDLIGEIRIAEIRPRGIEIEIRGERRLVEFTDTQPVEVASIEVPAIEEEEARVTRDAGLKRQSDADDLASGRNFQEVAFQNMTKEELRDILRRAEEKRRERGWVVESPD